MAGKELPVFCYETQHQKVEDRERQAQMVLRYFIDASETLFDPLVVVPGVASVILTLCWGGRLPLAPP